MKKKKHIENFFICRSKRFKFYYKKKLKKQLERKLTKTNFSKFYNIKVGLQASESGYLYPKSIKAVLKLVKWFTKKFKLKIFVKLQVFPDFILTSKPNEVRMGKGKGEPSVAVAEVKKNHILIEFTAADNLFLLKKLLKNCKTKLNLKSKIVWNLW